MNATKNVSNEDLLEVMQDLMQMTGKGFARLEGQMDGLEGRMDRIDGRMDGLDGRMDRIEARLGSIETELVAIKTKLYDHDLQLRELKRIVEDLYNTHRAYIHDIEDILNRLDALEKRSPI